MEEKPLVTTLDSQILRPDKIHSQVPTSSKSGKYLLFIFVIIAGLVTGYFLANRSSAVKTAATSANTNTTTANSNTNTTAGGEADTVKNPVGTLEQGGIRGEGTHKLVRDGGPSQTVYLVSSVVDLDSYVGKKVQIWGQTLKAKYAGWFIDVERLKIL